MHFALLEYFYMGLIQCVLLIEERAFSTDLERLISLGQDRAKMLDLDRLNASEL